MTLTDACSLTNNQSKEIHQIFDTETLALRPGKEIRVNSINPGVVETEGTRGAGIIGSDFEKGLVAQTPLGRTGQPGDIASVAVFLASENSAWVTGEIIIAGG